MSNITFIIDQLSGDILLESPDKIPHTLLAEIMHDLGRPQDIGCARPLEILVPPEVTVDEADICVRIAGYYHNSLIEGPGRRTSVLFQTCPLACKGCWVPQLHSSSAGILIPTDRLASLLLDSDYQRDGISILGGEPFAQPEGLLALIKKLRSGGCRDILCYTGHTYESLKYQSEQQPSINYILDEIDILIDGPYIESLSKDAGIWTGSGNQRVIDLAATRRNKHIVLYGCAGRV